MIYSFTVYGEPKPKRTGKICTTGRFARLVMDKGTREAEQDFGYASLATKPEKPLTGPLRLVLRLYRSKGMPTSKKGRALAVDGIIRPTTRPDNSNLLKMCEDALNGIYFLDDAQIVSHQVDKYFSDTPRTEVELSEVINF